VNLVPDFKYDDFTPETKIFKMTFWPKTDDTKAQRPVLPLLPFSEYQNNIIKANEGDVDFGPGCHVILGVANTGKTVLANKIAKDINAEHVIFGEPYPNAIYDAREAFYAAFSDVNLAKYDNNRIESAFYYGEDNQSGDEPESIKPDFITEFEEEIAIEKSLLKLEEFDDDTKQMELIADADRKLKRFINTQKLYAKLVARKVPDLDMLPRAVVIDSLRLFMFTDSGTTLKGGVSGLLLALVSELSTLATAGNFSIFVIANSVDETMHALLKDALDGSATSVIEPSINKGSNILEARCTSRWIQRDEFTLSWSLEKEKTPGSGYKCESIDGGTYVSCIDALSNMRINFN
jgi:hypothetical protein